MKDKIYNIIADFAKAEWDEDINPSTPFYTIFDSLDAVSIALDVEESLNVHIDDDLEMPNSDATISEFVDALSKAITPKTEPQ